MNICELLMNGINEWIFGQMHEINEWNKWVKLTSEYLDKSELINGWKC